nr:hypothetical protein BaRGS_023955 [Batillaria attramentaria]
MVGTEAVWHTKNDNNFEVNKESLPPQPEPDEPDPETDIKDLAGPMLGRPIIEPDNAGVKVVDKPEEEEESSGSSVGVTVGVVICCLAIMGAVLFVVVGQKKDTTSDTEKAIALMQTTQSAGDTVPERGKEEKKRKKNKKNKKGKTDGELDTTDENEAAKEPLLMA